jgi:hypothetical protein
MSSLDQSDVYEDGKSSRRGTRWGLVAALMAVSFLLGFVPMWITARERTRERDAAQSALRTLTLQNMLANAFVDARRSQYEPARKAASEFFTSLQSEIDRGDGSVFDEVQRSGLRGFLDSRDEIITLLARSDPASVDRLVALYDKYRQATRVASKP